MQIDRARRNATFTVKAPQGAQPADIGAIVAAGAAWWPLQMARELDDAILHLRTNELDIGTWILKTDGDAAAVLAADAAMTAHKDHWFVNETVGMLRRTFARLDVTSRSLFALIEAGVVLRRPAGRAGLLRRPRLHARHHRTAPRPRSSWTNSTSACLPMVNGQSRLARRFYEEAAPMEAVRAAAGKALLPADALKLGLVTATPDDIDWADEIRLELEQRAAMSPDALTGLEANLRFAQQENMLTRIFGRLTAWQNWIFQRPNAVGEKGALKVYGKGEKAAFDLNRV